MQEKTTDVANYSACIGLNIHRGKSKVLKVNGTSNAPIELAGESLEEVESFQYLGSIVDKLGGTEADIKARTGKARAAFNQMKKGLELQNSFHEYKIKSIQHHCQTHCDVWMENLESNRHQCQENTGIY